MKKIIKYLNEIRFMHYFHLKFYNNGIFTVINWRNLRSGSLFFFRTNSEEFILNSGNNNNNNNRTAEILVLTNNEKKKYSNKILKLLFCILPLLIFYIFLFFFSILINKYLLLLFIILYSFYITIIIKYKKFLYFRYIIFILLFVALVIVSIFEILNLTNYNNTIIFEISNYVTISRYWDKYTLYIVLKQISNDLNLNLTSEEMFNILQNNNTPEMLRLCCEKIKNMQIISKENISDSYFNYILNYGKSALESIYNLPLEHKIAGILFITIGLYFGVQFYNNSNLTEIIPPIINNNNIAPILEDQNISNVGVETVVEVVVKTKAELAKENLSNAIEINRINVEAAFEREKSMHALQALHRGSSVSSSNSTVYPTNVIRPIIDISTASPMIRNIQVVSDSSVGGMQIPLNNPNSCLFLKLEYLNYKISINGNNLNVIWSMSWNWFMKK